MDRVLSQPIVIEVIVADDRPTDQTLLILPSIEDPGSGRCLTRAAVARALRCGRDLPLQRRHS
jgi:hypothetical protein